MRGRIQIVISAEGELSVAATGFRGRDCEEATRRLETALGTVAVRRLTPERFLGEQVASETAKLATQEAHDEQ